MADYYPLLSRAVGGLPNSSEDARQAIYGRARKALLGQLQAIQPPVPQADIDREAQALDQAIARIEAELAVAAALGGDEAAASPAPVPPAVPAAPAPPVPPPPVPPLRVPPKPPAAPIPPPALPSSPPALPPGPPPLRPPAPAVRPSIPASAPIEAPPAGPAIQPPSAAAPGLPSAAAFDVKAGDAGAAVSPVVTPGKPDDAPPLRRPSAVGKPAAKDRTGLYAMLIAVALGAAAVAGYFAWQWRVTPAQISQPRPAPGASQPPANTAGQTSKPAPAQRDQRIVQRVPTGDAPASEPVATPPPEPATPAAQQEPAQTPAQPPAAPAQQAQAPQTPVAEANPGVPVAQRAAILIAAPTKENPDGVDTRIGTVVWRTDNVNRGASQPLSLAIRGDIDIPPAGLKVIITIEKNADTTLAASHMITIRFQREANSAVGEIADVDNLQMREQQSPQVEPLDAARAKITPNIFIVALTQSETITKRNVDSMLARGWLDLPMRLADGKIAKLTMEKGGPGDKIFKEVFARWEK